MEIKLALAGTTEIGTQGNCLFEGELLPFVSSLKQVAGETLSMEFVLVPEEIKKIKEIRQYITEEPGSIFRENRHIVAKPDLNV